MDKKPKIAENQNTQSQEGYTEYRENAFEKLKYWWKDSDNTFFVNLIIAGVVIVGSFIWFYVFKNLIQYMHPIFFIGVLFIATYVVSTYFSKVVKDGEEMKRKLIKWTPILLVFILYFLPSLDLAKFDKSGETLEWINIENGTTYHRPVNEIHEDSKGKYFFDPINGDTCRKATEHWMGVYESKKPNTKVIYHAVYDTVVDKIYTLKDLNKDGYIRTHVYGYDINALENPEIIIINLKGKDDSSVVIARVKKDKKIYASYRNPVASHRYTKKLCKDVDASVAIDIIGDARARVLLLNKRRVRQVLAQK